MNHRIGRAIFATAIGLLVAGLSYQWITNPAGREERVLQIGVVEAAKEHLTTTIGDEDLQIVDPLSPDRKVGKVYVYPEGDVWEVSGYYRREDTERWHPYLMLLDGELRLKALKAQDSDPGLLERSRADPRLEIRP
jgi:hypothetical protein